MSPEERKFIEDLYDQYSPHLWRYAYTYFKNRNVADELISDVFHVASEKPEKLIGHPDPRGWLFRTLGNKILKYNETRRRYAQRFLYAGGETMGETAPLALRPTEDQAEQELVPVSTVHAKIEEVLSQDELHLLKRLTLDKATHKTVAQELSISVWDSQKRLERIRKKLRKVFPQRPRRKK